MNLDHLKSDHKVIHQIPHMKHNNTMHIALIGLSRSETNTLKVILPRRLKSDISFDISDDQQPDLIMVCFDSHEAVKQWPEVRQKFPDVATICLSIDGKAPDNLPVVKRPVNVDLLIKTIHQAMRHQSNPAYTPKTRVKSRIKPASSASSRPGARTFNPDQKLIGAMLTAKKLMESGNQDVLVKGLGKFLFMTNGMVFSNKNCHALNSLCVPDLHPGALNVQPISPVQKRLFLAANKGGHLFPLDEFLWEIARHCSRGALPPGLNDTMALKLNQWPNCTRLTDPLLMAAISAVFARQAISIRDAAERFNLPYSKVVEYASAAYLLSSLQPGEHANHDKPQMLHGKWSTSILGKLARRLAGRVFGKTA